MAASVPRTNLPNEAGAWDSDWSYAYLERLYARLKAIFEPVLLGDAPEALAAPDARRVFVRHDLDVSLARALPLARREQAWGVRSTYHVMLDSPFYDARAAESREALAELVRMGHEVGLHYDVAARGTRDADPAAREADIGAACQTLEDLLGQPVRSVSFHLPIPDLVKGPLRVAGRVSAYARELFEWYLSDSRARWREGEPLSSLERPKAQHLQILIHPIWWGEAHEHATTRLRDFLLEVGPSLGRSFAELNEIAWTHIIYRAAEPAHEAE